MVVPLLLTDCSQPLRVGLRGDGQYTMTTVHGRCILVTMPRGWIVVGSALPENFAWFRKLKEAHLLHLEELLGIVKEIIPIRVNLGH